VLARERFRRLLAHLGARGSGAAALSRRYMNALAARGDLRPGGRRVLARLGRRFLLATVTNGIDRVQRLRLRVARIDGHFDAIVTSQGCGFAKPDPRIVHVALDALRVGPKEALLVGDDPESDGRAAAAAGVRFCWMDDGKPLRAGVWRPPLRVTHLAELPGLARTL
jgi:putative hydrolase of the HAD superfamily